jgi:hypothetical protein
MHALYTPPHKRILRPNDKKALEAAGYKKGYVGWCGVCNAPEVKIVGMTKNGTPCCGDCASGANAKLAAD